MRWRRQARWCNTRAACARDVEFSPEDAGRSDPAFLWQVLNVAVQAGATTLNIPDTVGYCTPQEYGRMIEDILTNVPGHQREGRGHQHALPR